MLRTARASVGRNWCHFLNRGNCEAVPRKAGDYDAFMAAVIAAHAPVNEREIRPPGSVPHRRVLPAGP